MNTTVVQLVYSLVLTTECPIYALAVCLIPNYYYEARQLSIVTSGFYRTSCNSSIALHGYIYQDTFNPFNSSSNLRAEKDGQLGFHMIVFLESNTTYVLVVGSRTPYETGAFSIVTEGPNRINARRIGKFDCFYQRSSVSISSLATNSNAKYWLG